LQTDAKSIQKYTNVIENRSTDIQNSIVETSHQALERLALREALRFHSWR
jgi:hypothetical protein